MAAQVENLGTLERRISMSVPLVEIERRVDERLKQLARNVKLAGFRPGKVPMKIVIQQYGPQVRSEVLSDAVQKAFGDAIKEANLKVAGYPRIEQKTEASTESAPPQALEFSATFEVYPEIKLGNLSSQSIERPQLAVDDAAVDRTIEVLRKQRTTWSAVTRPAQDGDRVTVDYEGRIAGERFEGGSGTGTVFVLGEGKMLPAFEASLRGAKTGESKTFGLEFPADYGRAELAGKGASFSVSVTQVEEGVMPAVDGEFARRLGIADGDVEKMRAEVKANVEREVRKRVEARVKEQALQALLAAAPLELPKSLVQMETQRLMERAAADLQARGLKPDKVPLDPQVFEAGARKRVALGLIFAEVARAENLQPKPGQVRALIDAEAQSYENPAEVVKWFYLQPERLSEMESLALEANVVEWVAARAKVTEKAVSFDELMGSG
ncbi:MAG TPA: trigger factor [Burkholderiales bacterium]|jgi:trigger factor|nr:trigger factor [Burkholderiales bacterium]